MKKKILKWFFTSMTVLCSAVIPINVSGQSSEKVTDTMVTMIKINDDVQTVILLEKNNIVVKVTLSDFRSYVDDGLKKDPHSEYYKKLLDILALKSKNEKAINVSNLLKADSDLYSTFEHWIAYLLENGRCLISNTTGKIISEVRFQKYIFYIAPEEFSSAGRRFYANEILILQVTDIIS